MEVRLSNMVAAKGRDWEKELRASSDVDSSKRLAMLCGHPWGRRVWTRWWVSPHHHASYNLPTSRGVILLDPNVSG